MLGLFVNGVLTSIVQSIISVPLCIFTGFLAFTAMCGFRKCMTCRLRDCACCKRFLRLSGHDDFDDFDLMMLVHEAQFDGRDWSMGNSKLKTVVRITAGAHVVRTDWNAKGIFQQPLYVTVEQGVRTITVDLLGKHECILATLSLSTAQDVLPPARQHRDRTYSMTQKRKGILSPRIKLTLAVQEQAEVDPEMGHFTTSPVDAMLRMQLAKVQKGKDEPLSEMQVLKEACAGQLEIFEGLGKTHEVYLSVLGPPDSRRWVLGIWNDAQEFTAKRAPMTEVELTRIQSIQSDPERHHIFVLNYFDAYRVSQSICFRRVDRARDVWVEIIRLLVQKVHDNRAERRTAKSHHIREAIPSKAASASCRF